MLSRHILLGLGLLLASGSAPASLFQSRQVLAFEFPSVVYTQHAPLTPQNLPLATHSEHQTLQFAGFDTSLGSLKNAYLSYEGTYAIQYLVTAGTRPPHWDESAVWGGSVAGMAYYAYAFGLTADSLGGPIAATVEHGAMTTTVAGRRHSGLYYYNFDGSGPKDAGDGTIDGAYRWEPWVNGGDLNVPLLDLADGLDVWGTTVDVDLEKKLTLYMAPFFSSFEDPDESYVYNDLNTWFGKLALTYEYEASGPVPVSEPGALPLVVIGMLLLLRPNRAVRWDCRRGKRS